ncbi:hypothetical protein N9X25_09310, partial [Verrucomicrobiales bacterium]|nr:hypothetical protein [Verrucomicrobiales bacterium]
MKHLSQFLVVASMATLLSRSAAEDSESPARVPIRFIESAWIFGAPMRKYDPLRLGGDFRREQIRELRTFFPELASLDTAKGIDPVDLPISNRVQLLLRSKVHDSYRFDINVFEGASVWSCDNKFFRLQKGWPEFVARNFATQEENAEKGGELK